MLRRWSGHRPEKTSMNCTDLLVRLIAVPSVNPEEPDPREWTGEARMAELMEALLRERGFEVAREEDAPGRPNVIARSGPRGDGPSLLIEAHMDTVSVVNMKIPPFEARVADGRIYGRGACDVKGSLAALLAALDRDLVARFRAAGRQLVVVCACGEEKGNLGARQLTERGLGADQALILEPTDLRIIHRHKGALWCRVRLEGRSGHGSAPARGVSAIRALAELIPLIEARVLQWGEGGADPDLSGPSVNFGRVEGGISVNIIPDRAELDLDIRLTPELSPARVRDDLAGELQELVERASITGFSIETIQEIEPLATPRDTGLVRSLTRALESEGLPARSGGVDWCSDAPWFARTCGETVVFGPGSIRQAHTEDEFIEVAELETGARVLRRFLEQGCEPATPSGGTP